MSKLGEPNKLMLSCDVLCALLPSADRNCVRKCLVQGWILQSSSFDLGLILQNLTGLATYFWSNWPKSESKQSTTVWGGKLLKRLKMFPESSPCLLGQHGSCSTAQQPGNSRKTFYKTFGTSGCPTWYKRKWCTLHMPMTGQALRDGDQKGGGGQGQERNSSQRPHRSNRSPS